MRINNITHVLFGVLVGVILMLAMVVLGHQSSASADGITRHRQVQCTETINGEGNASINGCHTVSHPLLRWQTRTCTHEYAVNCFWNARKQGNHRGHSFYVRSWDGNTCVFYRGTKRYARTHDYCA